MIVKICGLRCAEHALVAAAAGASMLGVVFAPSRRQVSVAEAAALATALRAAANRPPLLVGLFVNAPLAQVRDTAAAVGLDALQLSGDEPPSYAEQLVLPIVKSVRLDGSANEQAWVELAREEARGDRETGTREHGATGTRTVTLAPRLSGLLARVTLLADAHVPGAYGGTGMVADWARAADLARSAPLLLAGGLTPENVVEAISAVQPLGVDVSSGVETDGVKDPAKIEAFLRAALAAR
jgi:phosphoribosylanthranilate isomerase